MPDADMPTRGYDLTGIVSAAKIEFGFIGQNPDYPDLNGMTTVMLLGADMEPIAWAVIEPRALLALAKQGVEMQERFEGAAHA